MRYLCIAVMAMATSSLVSADTVRLSDGNSCSFSTNDHPWELGFSGKKLDHEKPERMYSLNNRQVDRFEIGMHLKYKFGGPDRLDCSKLYNMQLATKEQELKLLKEKLKIAESSTYIKWD